MRVPLLPVKLETARRVSRHFLGLGEIASHMFPGIHYDLEQSGIDWEPRHWSAVAIYAGLTYFFLVFAALFVVSVVRIPVTTALPISFLAGLSLGMASFFYINFYPRLKARKKVKEIESNLSHALRHLLIEVRSGVPLFHSMLSIAKGGYGALSDEFSKTVAEINTGKSEVAALELLARENPSVFFRRIIWQLVNAMKSGADVGRTLKEIVDDIAIQQKVSIKKYGSELNPLALFYMMLVVIFPTLGIVFLLVLTAFVGTFIDIQTILIGILFFLVFVQFMFMGLIKSRRPAGI